jgi:hypothetical protein
MQCTCDEGGLDRDGKFRMKVISERESVRETKIDGPTVVDESCTLAALKPHSVLTL